MGAFRKAKGSAYRARPGERSGFTLIELLLVMSVFMIALLAMSQALVASVRMQSTNREMAIATDAARQQIEILQGVADFTQVFALYNSWAGDDPGGIPAPGNGFDVPGLRADPSDPDGQVGEVVFPVFDSGVSLELREDTVDEDLAMPRDLNGDTFADNLDHAADYQLLPVTLRLRWIGKTGVQRLEVHTLLADR